MDLMYEYKFGPFVLNEATRELQKDGKTVKLQNKPFDFLLYLIRTSTRGNKIPVQNVIDVVWSPKHILGDGVITAHVHNIRAALDDNGKAPQYIFHGAGRVGFIYQPVAERVVGGPDPPPSTKTDPPPPTRSEVEIVKESGEKVIWRGDLTQETTQHRPGAAFRILLLYPKRATDPVVVERKGSKFALKVDLTGQGLGIYSNAGKSWLRDKHLLEKKEIRDPLLAASKEVHSFFMGRPPSGDRSISWKDISQGSDLPLRWTSGGILPIVTYQGQQWAVLFFRDILPLGWNVGNGASETQEEWLNTSWLSARELAEELIVLNRKPKPGGVLQYCFMDDYEGSPLNPLLGTPGGTCQFMEAHNQLRLAHDGVTIDMAGAKPERKVKRVTTDFKVEVKDVNGKEEVHGNFLFSLNPLECGIETIRLCTFKLENEDWLVDGEISPSTWNKRPYLLRRPVMLLSVTFLQEQLDPGGSFGPPLGKDEKDRDSVECKKLPNIPIDAFRLFVDFDNDDIDLREARKDRIKEGWRKLGCDEEDLRRVDAEEKSENLEKWKDIKGRFENRFSDRLPDVEALYSEYYQISKWQKDYGDAFKNARKTGFSVSGPLTTLCPVTWKTLELAFKWGYLGKPPATPAP